MKKLLLLFIIIMMYNLTSYATPLMNGLSGEIIVKYDNEIYPSVLLAGKTMDLTVKIDKNDAYSQPKIFVGLFENNKLKTVQVISGIDLGTEYQFSTLVNLNTDLTNTYMKIFLWEQEMKPISENLKLVNTLYPIIYKYDKCNRIETITFKDKVTTYSYDTKGNLTSKSTAFITQNISAVQPVIKTENLLPETESVGSNSQTVTNETQEQVENFLSLDNVASKAFVGVEIIDGMEVTVYDLSLLDVELFNVE